MKGQKMTDLGLKPGRRRDVRGHVATRQRASLGDVATLEATSRRDRVWI